MSDKVIDQSRVDGRGNFLISVAGRDVDMPLLHETLTGQEPVVRFAVAANSVNEFAEVTKAIESDATLSELGRTQKIDPHRENAVRWLAGHIVEVDKFEKHVDAREANLLAVPTLHREAAAEAVVDGEIRAWWRSLPVPERAALMKRMNDEPGHERIEIALLRSPYALADLETKVVRESWNRAQRLNNPAEANAIDQGRVVTEWARRGFGHLIGITTNVTKFPRERVLSVLLKDEHTAAAAPAFGFGADVVAHALRQLDATARRRSA